MLREISLDIEDTIFTLQIVEVCEIEKIQNLSCFLSTFVIGWPRVATFLARRRVLMIPFVTLVLK